jgi:hypothetical protein
MILCDTDYSWPNLRLTCVVDLGGLPQVSIRAVRHWGTRSDCHSSGGGVDEALLDLAFAVSPMIGIER